MSYIQGMKRTLITFVAVAGLSGPVMAQDDTPGNSLMEEGMRLFLDGLRSEMAPALQDLQGLMEDFGPSMLSFMEEMGPAFSEMFDEVRDWTQYHPPEVLPNGDIILRRKVPAPEPAPEATENVPTDI